MKTFNHKLDEILFLIFLKSYSKILSKNFYKKITQFQTSIWV